MDHRTTEIRDFERDCYEPEAFGHICDNFQQAFRQELEEIQALKTWAAEQAEEASAKTGRPVGAILEEILYEVGVEYRGIIRKSNFLTERRKVIEDLMAQRRGDKGNVLETRPISFDDDDRRVFEEPQYMTMLDESLSDESHYFSQKAKRMAKRNRESVDEAYRTVREAEMASNLIRRQQNMLKGK